MAEPVSPRLRKFARTMRAEGTGAERKLWAELRDGRLDGLKFRRQAPIGNAIADFVCYRHRLIVELDGDHHDGNSQDQRRDALLSERGFRVLRIPNREVAGNLQGVLDTILSVARRPLTHRAE